MSETKKEPGPCDCWCTSDKRLPHRPDCASIVNESRELQTMRWMLLARLLMEVFREPSTQVTAERGAGTNVWGLIRDAALNDLITLRFVLPIQAEDRVWPDSYPGEEHEVAESLMLAITEHAAALLKNETTPAPRLPPTQQQIEDAVERAYWKFETFKTTKQLPEREAYKTVTRSLLSAVQSRKLDQDWTTEGSPMLDALRRADQSVVDLARSVLELPDDEIDPAMARALANIALTDRGERPYTDEDYEIVTKTATEDDETTS